MHIYICIVQSFISNKNADDCSTPQTASSEDLTTIEAALQLKDLTACPVTAIILGTDHSPKTLTRYLAMGVDKIIFLPVSPTAASDLSTSAHLFAAVLQHTAFNREDIVFCGSQESVHFSTQLGAYLSEILALPQATSVKSIQLKKDILVLNQFTPYGYVRLALPKPCLIVCSENATRPRRPTVQSILKSSLSSVSYLDKDSPEMISFLHSHQFVSPLQTIWEYPIQPRRSSKPNDASPASIQHLVRLLQQREII